MKKKLKFSVELKGKLKETLYASPLLASLLDELERIENIRDSLYDAYSGKNLFEEYTNKAGHKNLIINAAVKEYKAYSQRFNDLIKTIHLIIKDVIKPEGGGEKEPEELDAFEKLIGRDKNAKKSN